MATPYYPDQGYDHTPTIQITVTIIVEVKCDQRGPLGVRKT